MNKNLFFFFLSISPVFLFGYLDPGSGSMLIYFIMGLFATLAYSIKNLIFNIKNTFLRLFSKHKINLKQKKNIVFYSEGGHYYEMFRPIIERLNKMNIYCSYYTSDKQDKGLEYKNKYCDNMLIGESKFAVMSLNYISAKILVMTTPQLGVMHLKKSKNVGYFIHLMHTPNDVFKIKPFAFDFFDCVMCSGQHQLDSIRLIEQTRSLPPKNLLKTGLIYFDGLVEKKIEKKIVNKKTILVAPTWGEMGLFSKVGFEIIDVLLKMDFNIIIRPHPQSFVNEMDLMKEIEEKSKKFKQIKFDTSSSASYSMNLADIMITDTYGIVFDFAFVYTKPIIAFKGIVNESAFVELNIVRDYHKINKQRWELENMDKVATIVDIKDLSNLKNIIQEKLQSDNIEIKKLRDKSIFNYGHAGDICAKQLKGLLEANIR